MRASIITLLLMTAALGAVAQGTGVRIIVPEYTKRFQKGPNKGFQFGIGVDHDLNDRLSVGLDLVMDLGSLDNLDRYDHLNMTYGAYTMEYGRVSKTVGVTYRTAYAFSDNESGHLYLGTFLGVRTVQQRIVLDYWGGSSGSTPLVNNAQASRTVVPMGVRLGVRSGLDGGLYEDLYAQVGYCLGGGKSGFTQPYLQQVDGLALAKFTFSIGLAFGFGW